jgi:predicted metal-binding protein
VEGVNVSADRHAELESVFAKHGYADFKWIDPQDIVVSHWVRMKCTFGCGEYGSNATCPPNVPSVEECRQFFGEYYTAAVFHFQKTVDKPESRHAWTREVNLKLLELEREVFLSGYHKAFLLFMDSCCICKKCAGERGECKRPKEARPAPEAMAVDVYATVRKYGFPIEVLTDYSEAMNRYAFLMID